MEKTKQHEQKGPGHRCLLVAWYPFPQVYVGEVLLYWWAAFEPDIAVRLKKEKKKHYPYKSDFKISVNSPLGSKKHISKQ